MRRSNTPKLVDGMHERYGTRVHFMHANMNQIRGAFSSPVAMEIVPNAVLKTIDSG